MRLLFDVLFFAPSTGRFGGRGAESSTRTSARPSSICQPGLLRRVTEGRRANH